MSDLRSEFFRICHFPEEAIEAVQQAEENLHHDVDFNNLVHRFYENEESVWTELRTAAQQHGIHTFTADLLLLVCCVPEAKQRYKSIGISENIYWDSMKDIRYKMMETHHIHGIWGVYCGQWLAMLLKQQCICLGRLQFEPQPSHFACQIGEHVLHKGDPVLNVHIPSFGKLLHEDVEKSYQQATAFFRDMFPNGQVWIQAETWILYPKVNAMLPEGNMRHWADDYHIVHAFIDPNQDDRYRIFHLPNGTPMEQYPETNPLQCKLKSWLMEGNRMGIGFGYLLLINGEMR